MSLTEAEIPSQSPPGGPEDRSERVCVIGAGPAGIAMCRALKVAEVRFDCVERRPQLGGLWNVPVDGSASCSYDSLHANTSRTVMQYPSLPIDESLPAYLSHRQVLDYLESYVDHHGVREHIRCGVQVVTAAHQADGRWLVVFDDGSSALYRAVLVASGGRHGVPEFARYQGTFSGRELHASQYRSPEEFAGKRVLIIGLGATSADVASEVSRVAAETYLSVRTGHYVVPKILEGGPIDKLSPLMSRLSVEQRRPLATLMIKLVHGKMSDWGLPDPPYKVGQGPMVASSELLPAIAHGRITPVGVIRSVDQDQVEFADGRVVGVDAIVHCTGYTIDYPFLEAGLVGDGHDAPPLYHQVVAPETSGLYFIGLLHSMTALMPLAERQAEWVADLLTGEVQLPDRATMWRSIRDTRRRQDKRFHDSSGHLLVDPREYMQLLDEERQTNARSGSARPSTTRRT